MTPPQHDLGVEARRSWWWRGAALLSVVGVLGGLGWAGDRFHAVGVLATALAVCALAWAASDLARDSSAAEWRGSGTSALANRGRDYRLSHLAKMLAEDDPARAQQVVTAIVERTLTSRYGTSLADPARSRAVLGPDLHDFVSTPPRTTYDFHRRLPGALTRIEEL